MRRRERRRAARLAIGLLVALVAVTAVGLGTFRVPVTGPSMAPAIYGLSDGSSRADTVLVGRWAYWFRVPRRFDTVVFRHPADPERLLVKRVAGLPGEEVWIDRGELYVEGRRFVKSDADWERVRVPLFDLAQHDPAEFWNLRTAFEPVLGPGKLRLDSGTLYTDYRRADGSRARGHQPIQDVELELALERPPAAVCSGSVEIPPGFVLDWQWGDAAGMAEVRERRTGRTLERFSLRRCGERLTLRFRQVDGRLHLVATTGSDDALLLHWTTPLHHPDERDETRQPQVQVVLEGAGTRIRGLRLWRDLYYTSTVDGFGVRRPLRLADDAFFMLGDNSVDSSDSREFGEIARRAILGRVDFVLSPWDRMRPIP